MVDREYADKIIRVSILKGSQSRAVRLFSGRKALKHIGIILAEIVILIAVSIYLNAIHSEVTKSLAYIIRVSNARNIPMSITVLEREAKMVKKLDTRRKASLNVVEQISESIPNDLWLTEINMNPDGTVEVKGESMNSASIVSYMSSISNIKDVKSVRFENGGMRKRQDGTYEFAFLVIEKWHKERKKGAR